MAMGRDPVTMGMPFFIPSLKEVEEIIVFTPFVVIFCGNYYNSTA
jgi:hypothetical protein